MDDDSDKKPTYYDIKLLQSCLKKFVACNGEQRSSARTIFLKDINRTMKVFLDDFKEQSFKKCIDVHEIAQKLS